MQSNIIMVAVATARWNKEKGCWNCQVVNMETLDNGKILERRENDIEVEMCDEFVLPYAILESNGINAKAVFGNEEI